MVVVVVVGVCVCFVEFHSSEQVDIAYSGVLRSVTSRGYPDQSPASPLESNTTSTPAALEVVNACCGKKDLGLQTCQHKNHVSINHVSINRYRKTAVFEGAHCWVAAGSPLHPRRPTLVHPSSGLEHIQLVVAVDCSLCMRTCPL